MARGPAGEAVDSRRRRGRRPAQCFRRDGEGDHLPGRQLHLLCRARSRGRAGGPELQQERGAGQDPHGGAADPPGSRTRRYDRGDRGRMSATILEAAEPAGLPLNQRALGAAHRRERALLIGICAPAIILTLVIIFLPVGWLSWLSLFDDAGQLSAVNYTRLVEQPSYVKTFKATFEVSIAVTVVCVILGYPLTYMLSQLPRRAAGIAMMFVILPFWTSVLVRTYAWLVILQRKGLVNDWLIALGVIDQPAQLVHNFLGVVIGMSHVLLPFLVLPLYASMRAIDRDYIRAAMNLGAGPSAAFWQVFFPLSLPGLAAGIVLSFVLCLGFFVTPTLMGGGRVIMWAMRMESTVSLYANWGAASALGVVLLVVTLGCLYIFARLFGAGSGGAKGLL